MKKTLVFCIPLAFYLLCLGGCFWGIYLLNR